MAAPRKPSTRRPAEPLTADEVRQLIAACSRRAPTGVRNAALVALLWRTGLRCQEALDLMPRDLDLDRGAVHVRHGKGDRSRVVGLDGEAAALLGRWLDRRATLGLNGRNAVFSTLDGSALQPSYVRQLLPRLGLRAGIERRVHAHALRHSFAAELAHERVPLNVIQSALGHSSIATTSRYLQHIAPTEVIETMKARAWSRPKGERITGKIGQPAAERREAIEDEEE